MRKIFSLKAGGYYAIGMCVVAANDLEEACKIANEASDKKLNLTYHPFGGIKETPVGTSDDIVSHVKDMHEWGMPELPSKGSGKSVKF